MSLIPEAIQQKVIANRRTIIAASILLIIILLVSFGPTYIARHLVSSTLDDFGIKHEGIKTVRINPWKREVWAGPVLFRAGDSDPGQLGEVGIKVNIFPVFRKRAMVESVLIRGIDITVTQTEDDAITVNGIPLDQFKPTTETPESAEPEKESKPWGTGLGNFDIQNSRLLLRRKTGAMLTVEIESFKLSEFESWHPDDPGTFELIARANNIELDLKGNARPFAQHVTLEVDTNTREVSLDKIIDFIGPLNLDRHTGVYHSATQHEITLFDSGRIEGHSIGKVTLNGADYAIADQFAFTAEKADVDLDVNYSLSETEDVQLAGKLTLDMANANGKLSEGDPFSIGNLRASFTELSAFRGADETIKFSTKHIAEVKNLGFSGRINLSMDAFTDVLRILQSISAKKEISEKETGLDKWAGDEVTLPKADITVEQINASVSKLEMNSANGQVSLDIKLENKAKGLKVATTERASKVEAVDVKIDTLRLNSGEGKTGLALTGSNAVTGFNIKGPLGSGGIKAINLDQNIELHINQGDITLQGSSKVNIKETQMQADKTETLPKATIEIGKVSTNIKKATFSTKQQSVNWQVDSGASIEGASVNYAEGEMSSVKIQRLDWRGASADQDLNIATEALTISGLEATTTRQFIDGLMGDKPKQTTASKQEDDEDNGDKAKTTPAKTTKDDPNANNVKLGRFELVNGAKLKFLDQKVVPPILVDLHIKKAEVHGIDSRNPESKAQANMVATINEFTNLEIHGNANNVGPEVNMNLTGKLTNLELPPYSSYFAEFAGVNLRSGQFNTDLAVKSNQGALGGAVNLHIKDLEFSSLSQVQSDKLSNQVGMPVETAVKLLKDPKGNIDLALPVTGTFVEPSVEIGSAISKAVSNTLKAVMPHSLIGSVVSSISKGGEQAFKPILFKPGSSGLEKEAKQYLDELVNLLNERPSLSLKICGRATPEDFKEITFISLKLPHDAKQQETQERQRLIDKHSPELLKLATERTRVVRRYLITDKGLKAAQVGECRLIFNPEDTEPPRVAVTL